MGRETHGHYSGLSLGSVHLHDRIGGGGMGEIYKGYHDVLEMDVAVKVILPGQGTNEDLVKRFVREARACTQLSHPNILKVYNADKHDETYYIVMEYVDGTDLRQVLKRHKRVPWNQTIAIVEQTASGLAYAHKKGVVHRDIKPDNLLMTRVGEIKIADFGLALLRTEMTGVTSDGVFLGTPLYMSPEQCEGNVADWRADIYSLGATWYHLVAGRPPFIGDSPAAVIAQHMVKEVPFPDELFAEVPPVIVDSLAQMMARGRDHRMQSLDDLVERLRGLSNQSKLEQRQAVQQVVQHTRRLDGIRDSGQIPRAEISPEAVLNNGDFDDEDSDDEAISAPPVQQQPESTAGHSASGSQRNAAARPASGVHGQARNAAAPSEVQPGGAPASSQGNARPSQYPPPQQAPGRTHTTDSSGRLTTSSSSSRAQAATPTSQRRPKTPSRPWESLPGLGSSSSSGGISAREAAAGHGRGASSTSSTHVGLDVGAAASSSTSRLIQSQRQGDGTGRRSYVAPLLVLLFMVLGLAGGALVWLEPAWLFGEQRDNHVDPLPPPESAKGPWIYFVHEQSEQDEGRSSLWRVRPNGRELERLAVSESDIYWPVASPDGRLLAFVDGRSRVRIIETAEGRVTEEFTADSRHRRLVGPLGWLNDNELLVLDDNHSVLRGTLGSSDSLRWFEFTGQSVTYFDPDRHLGRLIYTLLRPEGESHLVIEDRPLNEQTAVSIRPRLDEPLSENFAFPRISLTGDRLAMLHLAADQPVPSLDPAEAANTFGHIVVAQRNGRNAELHIIPQLRIYGPVGWLPDDRLLFTALDEQGRANLYAMPEPGPFDQPEPKQLLPVDNGLRPRHATATDGPVGE